MSYFGVFTNFFMHTEKFVFSCIEQHILLAYLLIFLVVFLETGLIFCFFLPGDAFLFLIGGIAAVNGAISINLVIPLLIAAAILGASLNYVLGRTGGMIFLRRCQNATVLHAWLHAKNFYEKHGGKALVSSRFLPFLRTFVPFVAGMSAMQYSRFMLYNLVGAVLWICSMVYLGYFLGEVSLVKENRHLFLMAGICSLFVPLLSIALHKLKHFTRQMKGA